MEYQIKVITDVVTEPITLAMQKAYSRIDSDYAEDDSDLLLKISAARELIEAQINIGCGVRTLELQWYGNKIELPFSPTGDIVSVKDGDDTLTDDQYTLDGFQAKSIWVNSQCDWSGNWFYSLTGGYVEYTPNAQNGNRTIYKAQYETGYEQLPSGLKNALMEQCDYMLKTQGQKVAELSKDALRMANQYSRNLIL